MSLRLRLTLLYTAILAVVLIVFSVVLLITVSRVTLGDLERALSEEADHLVRSPRFHFQQIARPIERFGTTETFVQTVSADGTIVDRTANLGDLTVPVSGAALSAVRLGRSHTEMVSTASGRLLVHSVPLPSPSEAGGVVQIARSLVDYDQSLATLRRILIIGGALAGVVAFGIGWLFTGAALRPINRIMRSARVIGAERDFGRRVEYAGPNDELGRLVATLNDMLAELQSAYTQLGGTLRVQRRFVADASHELRTPLTTIRGNLALLERDPPIIPDDRAAVLDDAVAECERLIRLVNDLLALARADAGQPLRTRRFDLQLAVADVWRNAETLGSGREIRCKNEVAADVLGDPDAFKQVLLALVDNALKHTPRDARVTIASTIESGRVLVRVQDTGPGVDPAVLPRVFDRFARGDDARAGDGFGLGLAIAKGLIELQGGTIHVESQPGVGSVFTVSLPLVVLPAGEAEHDAEAGRVSFGAAAARPR